MVKCTLCGRREAFFMRLYSGEKLCKRCFQESIITKVRSTISKYRMLEPRDRIAVAVSGGKDSVTLLHIMVEIEKRFPSTLYAVTIDEGIRGYRDEAMEIAAENCKKLGVEHITLSFKELYGYTLDEIVKLTKGKDLAPCSYCGVLRRKALNIAAKNAKVDKLATAHNLDDETQTILLNLMHGSPFRMAKIKPVTLITRDGFVKRIKPLCEVPEREIALYAYLKGIRFQSVPCPYAGEALRNDIRNILNRLEEKHPGIKYTIYRSMEKIRPALESFIEEPEMGRCKICGEPAVGDVCQSCQMLQELGIL